MSYGVVLHRERRVSLFNITNEELVNLRKDVYPSSELYWNRYGIKKQSVKDFFEGYFDYIHELIVAKGFYDEGETKSDYVREWMSLEGTEETLVDYYKKWCIDQCF